MTRPVVVAASQATLAPGSSLTIASRIASEIWSHILSGWPSVTDSDVKRYWAASTMLVMLLPRNSTGGYHGVAGRLAAMAATEPRAIDPARAAALDAADPLARFRDRFVDHDPGVIYLDGNSLGRLPRATADRLRQLVDEEWGGELVRAWDHWLNLPSRVGDALAKAVLGARPGEVGASDSPTVNFYKLAAPALRARPRRSPV